MRFRKFQGNSPDHAGSVLAALADMSVACPAWIEHLLEDGEHLQCGGLLEVVSFITLVALIALVGISVAAVTLLYAL